MRPLPRLALLAAIIAFLCATAAVLASLRQPVLGLGFFVFAAAGIGILRRRAWAAYGFAVFEIAQVVVGLAVLARVPAPWKQLVAPLAIALGFAFLFALAGRSLRRAGAERGLAWPWITASCLFTLPLLVFQAFIVPSAGMEDTLLVGDRILVTTLGAKHPRRGDIITFRYPADRTQVFVKRVIAVPGDHIRIVSKMVYLNGAALAEPYAVHKFTGIDEYRDNLPARLSDGPRLPSLSALAGVTDMIQNHALHGEVIVPQGKCFVLGDNRDNSLDSRYWGFVDSSDIIGKATLIYEPEQTMSANGGQVRAIAGRQRWNRIFHLL